MTSEEVWEATELIGEEVRIVANQGTYTGTLCGVREVGYKGVESYPGSITVKIVEEAKDVTRMKVLTFWGTDIEKVERKAAQ